MGKLITLQINDRYYKKHCLVIFAFHRCVSMASSSQTITSIKSSLCLFSTSGLFGYPYLLLTSIFLNMSLQKLYCTNDKQFSFSSLRRHHNYKHLTIMLVYQTNQRQLIILNRFVSLTPIVI